MPYNNSGTMLIRTYTAGGALPVPKSSVKISGGDENNRDVDFALITDIDGLTQRIVLPAPSKNSSLSPNPKESPYAQYNIEVSANGYYPKLVNGVALFADTDTFLPINMIPISVYENGVDFPRNTLSTTVIENPYL